MADKTEDALVVVGMRQSFYRDNYRRVVGLLILSIIVIAILAGGLAYIATHPPKPVYFATTIDGRISPLVPMNQPNLSTAALLQWANTAAIAAFNYNYVNYRQALQEASQYFTPDGWQAFLQAVQGTNNLNTVLAKKLMVTAVAVGAPVVLAQGLLNGVYAWKVQMPLLVTYQSPSAYSQQTLTVTMLVTRISTLNSPSGIGIAQFVAAEGNAQSNNPNANIQVSS